MAVKSFRAYRPSVHIRELRYGDNFGIHAAQVGIFEACFAGPFRLDFYESAHYGFIMLPLEVGDPGINKF